MGEGQRHKTARRAKKEAAEITAQNKSSVKNLLRRKMFFGVVFLIVLAIPCVAIISGSFSKSDVSTENKAATSSDKHTLTQSPNENHIPTLAELIAMPENELAKQDIAVVNLVCAKGLYGAENMDIPACLRTLDEWAAIAGKLLKEREVMFYRAPERSNHSLKRWQCGALVQFLNQIIGLEYNPSLKNHKIGGAYETKYFRDSRDFLIHGLIIEKKRGTCASMPVLFTAVARRLGYPIKLVTTRNHLFARWVDPEAGEVFNIEMTDKYAEFRPDEFYKSFPAQLNPGEAERQGYLIPLSPKRELSIFLHLRGMCLWEHGRLEEAREAMVNSERVVPQYKKNYFIFEIERQMYEAQK